MVKKSGSEPDFRYLRSRYGKSGSDPDFFRSCADSEQALRTPEQDADRRRINQESAELGNPVLARGIGHADEQRGDERAAQAAQAADRDHDEEVHQVLE